jgi:lysophospholipase L1-like esterase
MIQAIRKHSGAKIIWATTTPVQDDLHHAAHGKWKDFDRFNSDVIAYNRAAVEVCRELDVPVNDLYSLVMQAGLPAIQTADGVHFSSEGSLILGRAVAGKIREFIGK